MAVRSDVDGGGTEGHGLRRYGEMWTCSANPEPPLIRHQAALTPLSCFTFLITAKIKKKKKGAKPTINSPPRNRH